MEVSPAYVMKILKHRRISAPRAQKLAEVLGEIPRTRPLSSFPFLRELSGGPPESSRLFTSLPFPSPQDRLRPYPRFPQGSWPHQPINLWI